MFIWGTLTIRKSLLFSALWAPGAVNRIETTSQEKVSTLFICTFSISDCALMGRYPKGY